MRKIISQPKKPCERCPYTLGLIQTVINPCPQCWLSGYKSYERFWMMLTGTVYKD